MKYTKAKLGAAIAVLFTTMHVKAFDIHTHTAMTAAAVSASQFGANPNASLMPKKLGLFDRPGVLASRYIDMGAATSSRTVKGYEFDVMEKVRNTPNSNVTIPHHLSLPGWIINGAVREDDNTTEIKPGTDAADEPGGGFERVFAHFFDPQNDRALTVLGYVLGPRSPDWAVDSGATIPVSPINRIAGQNRYNIPSAREAMWRALTGKVFTNGNIGGAIPLTTDVGDFDTPAAQRESERKAYWATTFRAVGDVVHLVQDLAQPQHSRNDAHAGAGCIAPNTRLLCLGGHDSFFEKYLKSRTLRENAFTLAEGLTGDPTSFKEYKINKAAPLIYDGYPVPSFANYKDYFYTGTQTGGNANGLGIANYSNRGFFSFGTNVSYRPTGEPNSADPIAMTWRIESM